VGIRARFQDSPAANPGRRSNRRMPGKRTTALETGSARNLGRRKAEPAAAASALCKSMVGLGRVSTLPVSAGARRLNERSRFGRASRFVLGLFVDKFHPTNIAPDFRASPIFEHPHHIGE
jgi:hypothetical protein